jgi:hypothetical protein
MLATSLIGTWTSGDFWRLIREPFSDLCGGGACPVDRGSMSAELAGESGREPLLAREYVPDPAAPADAPRRLSPDAIDDEAGCLPRGCRYGWASGIGRGGKIEREAAGPLSFGAATRR